jgi:hypothetical protein
MAGITTKAIMQTLQTHLTSSGYNGVVTIGPPQKAPETWHASIELLEFDAKGGQETTLDKSIERRTVTITVYCPVLAETPERIEFFMDEVMVNLHSVLIGDFTLGGIARNIEQLSVRFSTETLFGGAEYRMARMTVPFIIDDSATYSP